VAPLTEPGNIPRFASAFRTLHNGNFTRKFGVSGFGVARCFFLVTCPSVLAISGALGCLLVLANLGREFRRRERARGLVTGAPYSVVTSLRWGSAGERRTISLA
jgi:hypothetical protein